MMVAHSCLTIEFGLSVTMLRGTYYRLTAPKFPTPLFPGTVSNTEQPVRGEGLSAKYVVCVSRNYVIEA